MPNIVNLDNHTEFHIAALLPIMVPSPNSACPIRRVLLADSCWFLARTVSGYGGPDFMDNRVRGT
jgi:hypothetical protein